MAPFLGQGANQAIQDGYCLAARLAAARAGGLASKVLGPLQSYALLRRAPVTALQIELHDGSACLFGDVAFADRGDGKGTPAKYVCLSADTPPEKVHKVLRQCWDLPSRSR